MYVFVDGSAGTTGLRILERLGSREDVELIRLDESERKNAQKRREAMFASDVTFLCLPDDAAREAVSLAEGSKAILIDASTAHRVDPRFAYGFPELSAAHRAGVRGSKRISVPGCHASGFVSLVYPLVASGRLLRDACLTCHSVTGFSGGGKKMIADYGAGGAFLDAPRQYALGQTHKHLKEMQAVPGLAFAPVFCPIVSNFYSGMVTTVPVFKNQLAPGVSVSDIRDALSGAYPGPVVKYVEGADENGFLSACALSGRDDMQVMVMGNDERILLVSRFDNLGKGSSGAAVQCMNLATGAEETKGLIVEGGAGK